MERHNARCPSEPAQAGIGAGSFLAVWLLAFPIALVVEPALGANTVEVPVLAAIDANNRGVFQVLVMNWDQRPAPDPIEARFGNNRVRVQGSALGALGNAFAYAVAESRALHPTGTITIYGAAYAPVRSDGPSAGAAMAVGFLALLHGDSILRGVAMTGTLQPGGRVGPVGALADKVRAAFREGYRTVLVPQGQLTDPRWNLNGLALELGVTIKEVATIGEAYELMTGHRL